MIDKEKFIEDIKRDLEIKRNAEINTYKKPETLYKEKCEFDKISDIIEEFFANCNNPNNPNNIFITCEINKKEAKYGCKKIIKYTQKTFSKKTGVTTEEKRKLEIGIPKGIKNDEKIIFREEGNSSKKDQDKGNLVVVINIK